jgi:hypothetical protein
MRRHGAQGTAEDAQTHQTRSGFGIAARPRSRHSFKGFVRTGEDAAGSKNRLCAQVVTRTLSVHPSGYGDRKYRDSDW